MRERTPEQLKPWLARAADSPLTPLQRFAKGIRDDYEAVKAGGTRPWSPGPVEGQMNRSSSAFSWRCKTGMMAATEARGSTISMASADLQDR